jgi:hypothetical protein
LMLVESVRMVEGAKNLMALTIRKNPYVWPAEIH